MTKAIIAALAPAVLTGAAQAQSRTFYDASGKVVGRSATDSRGTTTNYDSKDKVISHETTTGSTTTGGLSEGSAPAAKAMRSPRYY